MRFFILLLCLSSCVSGNGPSLGLAIQEQNGQKVLSLRPCPNSPNCKQSFFAQDGDHFITPIETTLSREDSIGAIEKILTSIKGVKIIQKEGDYLYATHTSTLFGFIDDIEFYFGSPGLIHFRSASRTGYWDLGVNQSRIETIKFKFFQREY